MPTSQEDFVLPGLLAQPQMANGLIVSTLFAHSRIWNRRRLESHLYGFWNQVLSQLVSDCVPDMLLVPQQVIYYAESPSPDPNCSENTITDDVIAERIPDFVIFATATRQRNGAKSGARNTTFPAAYSSWRQMRIMSAKPAAIIQIKRPPPRSIKKQEDFIEALEASLALAADDADNSASLAFNDESYKLSKVVLIAAAGEWWRFKVVVRADYTPVNFLGGSDEGDEQEERKGKGQKSAKRKEKRVISTRYQRHEDLPSALVAQVMPEADEALPPLGFWSEITLFVSPASNQRFYLVHQIMHELREAVLDDANDTDSEMSESGDDLGGYSSIDDDSD